MHEMRSFGNHTTYSNTSKTAVIAAMMSVLLLLYIYVHREPWVRSNAPTAWHSGATPSPHREVYGESSPGGWKPP